jgi:hypothetical protein
LTLRLCFRLLDSQTRRLASLLPPESAPSSAGFRPNRALTHIAYPIPFPSTQSQPSIQPTLQLQIQLLACTSIPLPVPAAWPPSQRGDVTFLTLALAPALLPHVLAGLSCSSARPWPTLFPRPALSTARHHFFTLPARRCVCVVVCARACERRVCAAPARPLVSDQSSVWLQPAPRLRLALAPTSARLAPLGPRQLDPSPAAISPPRPKRPCPAPIRRPRRAPLARPRPPRPLQPACPTFHGCRPPQLPHQHRPPPQSPLAHPHVGPPRRCPCRCA